MISSSKSCELSSCFMGLAGSGRPHMSEHNTGYRGLAMHWYCKYIITVNILQGEKAKSSFSSALLFVCGGIA